MNKTACLIAQLSLPENIVPEMDGIDQSRYNELSKCAVSSFAKFHPDVDLYYINDNNFAHHWEGCKYDLINHVGIVRFMLAAHLMEKHGYTKIIILGCDTITCARLDEFMNDNRTSILATLNYQCIEQTEYWVTPIINGDTANINADVVCFNGIKGLERVIELSMEHFTHFGEQGALNEIYIHNKNEPSIDIVDFPYPNSGVVYNARSKGVMGTNMIKKGKLAKHGHLDGQPAPTTKFKVRGNKLVTEDGKWIKCFHYVEGLGGRSNEEFAEIIKDFKENWFNAETKGFFRDKCGCTEFFN